jgi:exoribonuclease-2
MEIGTIIEYIEQQKIICAVIVEVKKQRFRLISETNREINMSGSRFIHASEQRLDVSSGRDTMVKVLKDIVTRRKALMTGFDLKALWELLHDEQEWIDLKTMTELCFAEPVTGDHQSAVIRAYFENRLYFKFNNNSFFPNSPEQVDQMIVQREEENRRKRLIEEGGLWLKQALQEDTPQWSDDIKDFVEILSAYYIFEKESRYATVAKAMLSRAGVELGDQIFDLIVRLGIWQPHENIDIFRYEIESSFSESALRQVEKLTTAKQSLTADHRRRDLTHLPLITIDGQQTRDFDDALSLEKKEDGYIVGIHIIDVAHYIGKDSPLDKEAIERGSSIYMPDDKLPMLPTPLSEDLCSLKAGELRPSISTLIHLNRFLEIVDHEVVASVIEVKQHLSYTETNKLLETDEDIRTLYKISQVLRRKRIDAGAVQINLPEVNLWIDDSGEIIIHKIDRESPSRMLVSEMMIIANHLMARLLADHDTPAPFRSQPEPKARLYKGDEGSLFQNCMQRKHLNRMVLGHKPEHHSGLGVDAYVTATSPIRRYFDLFTQRQIRGILGFETLYSADETDQMFQHLEYPMSCVGKLQYLRRRYWLLKHLENRTGTREEALVLDKRRDGYIVLLKDYMLECKVPSAAGINLKPEDVIRVVIQHVNARKDLISVYPG